MVCSMGYLGVPFVGCWPLSRSDEEGRAWLNYEADGVDLRANYFAILDALREHLVAGKAQRYPSEYHGFFQKERLKGSGS